MIYQYIEKFLKNMEYENNLDETRIARNNLYHCSETAWNKMNVVYMAMSNTDIINLSNTFKNCYLNVVYMSISNIDTINMTNKSKNCYLTGPIRTDLKLNNSKCHHSIGLRMGETLPYDAKFKWEFSRLQSSVSRELCIAKKVGFDITRLF